MKKIWDISPPVGPSSPVFEGDTRYSQQWTWRIGANCPVNVSAVTLSPHVGAHADAPLHYSSQGAAVGSLDLEPYLGPCRVIHALGPGPCVEIDELAHAQANLPPRVLLRTCERFAHTSFDPGFKAISPQTLGWLADRGVRLVGIDSASVDPATSKDLAAHQVLLQRDIRVLENLCLDEVEQGDYELIALPLKWMHCDASPVRAVLRPLSS